MLIFHDKIFSFLVFSPRSIGNLFSWGPVATDNYYHRETRFSQGILSNITVRQPMDSVKALRKLNIPVIIGKSYVRYDMLTSITIGLYFLMILIITITKTIIIIIIVIIIIIIIIIMIITIIILIINKK